MNNKDQLIEWLLEISRFQVVENFVQWLEDDNLHTKVKFHLFTKDNCYRIVALSGRKDRNDYLGCVASSRKPRAGEDWTRGRDLADGKFCHETWQNIKNDIIAFELVKVVKKEKAKADEVKLVADVRKKHGW